MTATIGVDIIEVDRVARALAHHGERFLIRVFTAEERSYCRDRAPELAARFAAKEAVAKALGTGIGPVEWREIEIVRPDGAAPIVRLHGRAQETAERIGVGSFQVSLAHTRQHAIAFVVASPP